MRVQEWAGRVYLVEAYINPSWKTIEVTSSMADAQAHAESVRECIREAVRVQEVIDAWGAIWMQGGAGI